MENYVIGIDAGGTKSHLAIFTAGGKKVGMHSWGPLNHEVLPGSFAQMEAEMSRFVSGALNAAAISIEQIKYGVFGLAGVDTEGQHKTISEVLRRIGFKEFTLVNDGFLGIPAGSESATGVCATCGTGESLFGLNSQGRMFQIGGTSYISSDMGGGNKLGQRVVSAVYRELFRKGEPTALTPLLFKELGVESKYDFVETIYRKTDDGTYKVRHLNRLLFEAAGQGDAVAIANMKEVAWNYAGGIVCMAEELEFPADELLEVILTGSVFVKGETPVLRDLLMDRVRELLPGREIRFSLFDKPPVSGAIIWALKCVNTGGDYMESVYSQM